MAKYITKSGDVWDNIAKEVYGSESYTSFLMENNKHLVSYFVFPEGIQLEIKDKPAEVSLLPDWRS